MHWLWRNPFYGFAVKTFDGSIWSAVQGGSGANVIIIDGGAPTTEFVANLDGGTP